MIFSLSTVLISIASASLLILILQLIIHNIVYIKSISYYVLLIISVFISLRLILPIEWTFTKTIHITNYLTTVYRVLYTPYTILLGYSAISFLYLIWIIGSLVKLFKLIKNMYEFQIVKKYAVNEKSIYEKEFSILSTPYLKGLYFLEGIDQPMTVYPYHSIICLPKMTYSKIELENIFIHEIQHIKNKDVWIKLGIELLTILYWWLPFIYIFKREVETLIELRVDHQISQKMDEAKKLDYIESLISVSRKLINIRNNNKPKIASQFTLREENLLKKRIYFYLDQRTKKRNLLALVVILLFAWISFPTVVFEPYVENTNTEQKNYGENELIKKFDLLKTKDGRFFLINKKTKKIYSEIKNPSTFPFNKMKLINESE